MYILTSFRIFYLVITFKIYSGMPIGTSHEAAYTFTDEEAKKYLQQFKYLVDDTSQFDVRIWELNSVTPCRRFADAVVAFQRRWGLDQTGILDRSTILLMKQARCGRADVDMLSAEDRQPSGTVRNEHVRNKEDSDTIYSEPVGESPESTQSQEHYLTSVNYEQEFDGDNEEHVSPPSNNSFLQKGEYEDRQSFFATSENNLTSMQYNYNQIERRKRYSHEGSKWSKDTINYRINNFMSDKTMKQTEVVEAIEMAWRIWADIIPLKFQSVQPNQLADIEIEFHSYFHYDNYPFDGRGKTLAHAFYPRWGGDVHFDSDENWSSDTKSGTNLMQVAAHEFGHSLGLAHSEQRLALMSPFFESFQDNFKLYPDDIEGVQALYGSRSSTRYEHQTENMDIPEQTVTSNSLQPEPISELCRSGTFDTITQYEFKDGIVSTVVFKGDMYFILNFDGIIEGFPRQITNEWSNLPGDLDAALYWKEKSTETIKWDYINKRFRTEIKTQPACTYLFKGSLYWKYEKHKLMPSYPRNISDGWRGIPDHIDAAFVWSGNGKTYFIKDGMYYRYTSGSGVDPFYPRNLTAWRGIPEATNAALQWSDGYTYFFSGSHYYRFDDDVFEVALGYPKQNSKLWLGCNQLAGSLIQISSGVTLLRNTGIAFIWLSLVVATKLL